MDNLDMKILNRLLNNCRESDRQIGIELKISGGAVRKRIQKMEGNGVIEKFFIKVEIIIHHRMDMVVFLLKIEVRTS